MTLRKYLPLEDYTLTSKLSLDEIRTRISDNLESKKNFKFPFFNRNTSKPYEGILSGDTFTINRIINYRNSFLPVITGNISTYLGGTQIHLKMRLAYGVAIFMLVWLGAVGIACIGIMATGFSQTKGPSTAFPFNVIPFGMFVFGCLLGVLPFKAETKKSKEFFSNLFEGQEENF